MTLHHAAAAPCCAVSPRSDRRHFILLYELCLASCLVTLVTVLYFLKLPSNISINVLIREFYFMFSIISSNANCFVFSRDEG